MGWISQFNSELLFCSFMRWNSQFNSKINTSVLMGVIRWNINLNFTFSLASLLSKLSINCYKMQNTSRRKESNFLYFPILPTSILPRVLLCWGFCCQVGPTFLLGVHEVGRRAASLKLVSHRDLHGATIRFLGNASSTSTTVASSICNTQIDSPHVAWAQRGAELRGGPRLIPR
jgi:hypothetical protein